MVDRYYATDHIRITTCKQCNAHTFVLVVDEHFKKDMTVEYKIVCTECGTHCLTWSGGQILPTDKKDTFAVAKKDGESL